jgi:hypothetical protein
VVRGTQRCAGPPELLTAGAARPAGVLRRLALGGAEYAARPPGAGGDDRRGGGPAGVVQGLTPGGAGYAALPLGCAPSREVAGSRAYGGSPGVRA